MSSERLGIRESHHTERIIAEATQLFAEQGYHRTGIADIERAVGLGRGALYYHIGDKEALLYEVSLRAFADIDLFTDALLSEPLAAEEQMRRLITRLLEVVATRLTSVEVFYREYPWLTGERRRELYTRRDRFEMGWSEIFDHGEADGTFAPTTPLVRRGLLGMITATHLWFRPGQSVSANELADEYTSTILSGIAIGT